MTVRAAAPPSRKQGIPGLRFALAAGVAIVAALLVHIGFGARFIPPREIWNALFHFDGTVWDHVVIRNMRVPRALIALSVGASLGLAGATMQAVTRNPLAGPSVLGMNAGAALAVVTASTFLGGVISGALLPWVAALGAVGAFGLVVAIASAGQSGPTPFKLTLAGVAIGSFAKSVTSAILIFDEQTLDNIRSWLAGSLASRSLALLEVAAPPMILGAILVLLSAGALNALALGEKAATGLGVSVRRTRLVCLVGVGLLAGPAVSVAGPIGFVGLVVPHIVKLFVPTENRLILPLSAVTGALMLILADLAGRTLLAPREVATGLMTALLGAPVFIYLVRSRL